MKKILFPLTCGLFFLTTGCGNTYEETENVKEREQTPAYRHSHRSQRNSTVIIGVPVESDHHHHHRHHRPPPHHNHPDHH